MTASNNGFSVIGPLSSPLAGEVARRAGGGVKLA
jgi:hypothetical protein